jgi:hypothetical protein
MSEETAINSFCSTNFLAYISEQDFVYSALKTESVNIIQLTFNHKRLKCSHIPSAATLNFSAFYPQWIGRFRIIVRKKAIMSLNSHSQ